MKLKEALCLIEDLESSFEESKTANPAATLNLPKLLIMESLCPTSEGYTLCIKKMPQDKLDLCSVRSVVEKNGLSVTSLCDSYWMIYTPKIF